MQFFLDTADVNEIRNLVETGLIDGVTTNPSLIAKSGRKVTEVIKEICDLVPGPVSAEVTATDHASMMKEAAILKALAENVTIKVPLTVEGLKACRDLSQEDVDVNVTLCFTPVQALLAAKAGARFVSPFVGRLDDINQDGLEVISDIRDIFDNYPHYDTEILAASIRSPYHVLESAKRGADVLTLPPAIFRQLYTHPLTEKGLHTFLEDWKKTGQSIL